MIVVDASVWMSSFVDGEIGHLSSRRFLRNVVTIRETIAGPGVLLAEVGGALARRLNDSAAAKAVIANIMADRSVRLFEVDRALFHSSAQTAADLKIRGYDAVYVALARELQAPLVTWDREQLVRAATFAETMTPDDATRRFDIRT